MYTEFQKLENGDLKIILTTEGREYLKENGLDGCPDKNSQQLFLDVIEYQLCNGWEFVRPEEIGALTSANIISDNVERDDHNNIISVDKVYAFMDYQIKLEVEELYNNGFCIFEGVEVYE